MIFGQLIEHNVINIFLKNISRHVVETFFLYHSLKIEIERLSRAVL